MSLRKLFGLAETPNPVAETHSVRKVVEALNQLPPEKARFIAAFGYILGRVANADFHISDAETRAMERLVAEHGHLPEEQALIVVQTAKTHNQLFGATENFLVTREFSRIASHEEKCGLLNCLFAVSAEDDDISQVEDSEVRQISSELGLEHRDYIVIRSAWKNKLKLMQNLPQGPKAAREGAPVPLKKVEMD
jgi:uncharacterized tellurite resistance protein B-like protein